MTISANPNRRSLGNALGAGRVEPFVELDRTPTNVGMRGPRHFERSALVQDGLAIARMKHCRLRAIWHRCQRLNCCPLKIRLEPHWPLTRPDSYLSGCQLTQRA